MILEKVVVYNDRNKNLPYKIHIRNKLNLNILTFFIQKKKKYLLRL